MTELTPAPNPARFGAYLLDKLVLLPLSIGLLYAVVIAKSLPLALVFLFFDALYKPLLEATAGQTLGKRWLGLRVVRGSDGGPISWNASLMRYLPWAAIFYCTVFVLVRHFQSPDFAAVNDLETYLTFSRKHPLGDNFLIALINYLPIFSVVWVFSDPLRRALHDRLAGTVVIRG